MNGKQMLSAGICDVQTITWSCGVNVTRACSGLVDKQEVATAVKHEAVKWVVIMHGGPTLM